MNSPSRDALGFFEALFGLLISPRETSAALIDQGRPRYGLTILVAVALTVWIPAVASSYLYGFPLFKSGALTLLTFLGIVSFVIFLAFEALIIRSFRRELALPITFACSTYSCAPVILVTWITYIVNVLLSGKLTLMTRLILGFGEIGTSFTHTLPYLLAFGALAAAVVFIGTLQGAAKLGEISSLLVTAISLLPLGLSILLATLLGEVLRPGAIQLLLSIVGQL